MNTIEQDYEIIIAALAEAKVKIEAINNPQIDQVKRRVIEPLNQNITSMSAQIGITVVGDLERIRATRGEPVLKMFGRNIPQNVQKKENPVAAIANRDVRAAESERSIHERQRSASKNSEIEVLKAKRNELIGILLETDSSVIFDKYDELTIRAAGILVGLPFTEKTPERITVGSIDMIKDALKKKQALEAGKDPQLIEEDIISNPEEEDVIGKAKNKL